MFDAKHTVNDSIAKGIFHSSIAPLIIFGVMYFIQKEYSLVAVGVWYSFATFFYYTTKEKQVTAHIYFGVLKYIFIGLVAVASLIGTAFYVSKYM